MLWKTFNTINFQALLNTNFSINNVFETFYIFIHTKNQYVTLAPPDSEFIKGLGKYNQTIKDARYWAEAIGSDATHLGKMAFW